MRTSKGTINGLQYEIQKNTSDGCWDGWVMFRGVWRYIGARGSHAEVRDEIKKFIKNNTYYTYY
jgi:hypothetical protein